MEVSLDPKLFSIEIDKIFSSVKTQLLDVVRSEADFFEIEESLQRAINAIGRKTLENIMGQYEIDADAVTHGSIRYNRAGKYTKTYQSVFGSIEVERTIYRNVSEQSTKCICPLELQTGVFAGYWTPKAAKIATLLMTELPSKTSAQVINEILQIEVSSSGIDRLMKSVGETWESNREKFDMELLKQLEVPAQSVSLAVSLDGVLIPTRCNRIIASDSRYEEASCGTISFLDAEANQLKTLYFSRSPERKKATLKNQLKQAFDHIIKDHPELVVTKIADGARDNWTFLEEEIEGDWELIDFYHAAEHLKEGIESYYGENNLESGTAYNKYRHKLRHQKTGATQVLKYLKSLSEKKPRKKKVAEQVVYFERNKKRMRYAHAKEAGLTIGSGIVEAACKTVVTQRLKRSGMRWDYPGAQSVLSLRAVSRSQNFDEGFKLIRETATKTVTPLRKIKRSLYVPIVLGEAA